MPVSDDFRRYVLEQLAELRGVVPRRMFGGVGLYHDGLFFGLIDDDVLYLKVDATTRPEYEARGMKPFCPFPDDPSRQMGGYYTVPAEVLEDTAQLAEWSRRACQVALIARNAQPASRAGGEEKAPRASKGRAAKRTVKRVKKSAKKGVRKPARKKRR